MVNHGAAAAALLIIASLLVAGSLGVDARSTMVVVYATPVPALVCNKVDAVRAEDTCFSVAEGAALTQEQFLDFNPNINCAKVFVGQWVCLDAASA